MRTADDFIDALRMAVEQNSRANAAEANNAIVLLEAAKRNGRSIDMPLCANGPTYRDAAIAAMRKLEAMGRGNV